MRTTRRRSRAMASGLGALAVGAVLLAGCGGSDATHVSVGVPKHPNDAQAQLVAAAAATTEAVQSATFQESFSTSTGAGGSIGAVSESMSGSFDRAAELADLHIDVQPGGAGASSAGTVGATEMITDGTSEYLKLGGSLGALDGMVGAEASKPWVKITLPSSDRSSLGFGLLGSNGLPGDPLAELEKLSRGVTDLGSATVDGVSTTHYDVTITPADLQPAAGQTTGTAPTGGASGSRAFDALGLGSAHIDVWIDQGGLIRRMTVSADGSGLGSGSTADGAGIGRVTLSYDLLTVNQPVHIQVPDPDQVSTMPNLCGALSSLDPSASSHGLTCSTGTGSTATGSTGTGSGFSSSTSVGVSVH